MTRGIHDARPAVGTDAFRLVAHVRGARDRARTAKLARMLSIALPVAIAGTALAGWMRLADPWLLAAAASAALLVAAAVSAVQAPQDAAVAELLDARLGLADRVSTAVRMRSRTDAVAQAIVRDAAGKLAPSSIVEALPYRAHPWAAMACVFAAGCVALWAAVSPPPATTLLPRGGGGPGRGTAGASVEETRGAADQATARTRNSGTSVDQERSGATTGEPAVERRVEGTGGDKAVERSESGAAAPGRPDTASANGSRQAAETTTDAASRARGTGRGVAPRSPGAAASGTAGVTAGRGAAPAEGPVRSGSGGVQQGQLSPSGSSAVGAASSAPASAAAVAAAQDQGDAAIAHDQVAPRYRRYLRDYYRLVGTMNQP